jgi:hypothetical protein
MWTPIEAALNEALAREPVWEERVRGAKIFYYSELVECLMHRIQKKAGSEITGRIRKEEMRAAAVPIDEGVERPAGYMPPSAITEGMFIGEDGCIHQSKNSTRKWKVSWIEEAQSWLPIASDTDPVVPMVANTTPATLPMGIEASDAGLQLREISRAWSKVSKDDASLLLDGLFAAFWKGRFETYDGSALFQLVSDIENALNGTTNNVSYAFLPTKDGTVCLTAETSRLDWKRRDLFLLLVDLEKTDRTGALSMRASRNSDPTEDEMKALATRPVATYSASFQSIWLPKLRIGRNPFAAWYSTSSLSAGASLETFWPTAMEQVLHAQTNQSPAEGAKSTKKAKKTAKAGRTLGRKPNLLWDDCHRDALDLIKQRGVPRPDDNDSSWRIQADFEHWINEWWVNHLPPDGNPPGESTVREYAAKWLDGFKKVSNGPIG